MSYPPRPVPRFVPTLTEVVAQPPHQPGPSSPPALEQAPNGSAAPGPAFAMPGQRADADAFEEYVVHRIMQRLDLVLEQRLGEAIARVTQEQMRTLVPRLREEVESVLRHALNDAVAQELAQERPAP